VSRGTGQRYWLERGHGPEGPYDPQTIIEFIDQGLRVANIALDGAQEWAPLDRHPDFAPTIEAAAKARDGAMSVPRLDPGDPVSAPADEPTPSQSRVPASHPDVVAFLDRGVRTGPALGPKMGLVVSPMLLLIGLGFMAIYARDVGMMAAVAFFVAVAAQGLFARWTVVTADRRGIGRVGWRRSWDDFETIDVTRRQILESRGNTRVVVITRFRFRKGRDLRVTTDSMTHTRELTRYAEITQAARRERVPTERLEKLRATVVAPKPSFAFPLIAFVGFVLLATPLTAYTLQEGWQRALHARQRREPPRSLSPRPVDPEPVHVPAPRLGELTIEAIQWRAREASFEELDLTAGADGLSLVATAEHRQSNSAVRRTFRVHFFDLDHLPSTGEPPPDDCRLFDEHVVCARGLGSTRLLAELDPTVTLSGLRDALEAADHPVEGDEEPHHHGLVDQLTLQVGDPSSPIVLRGASWQRAMEDPDEDTVAAVAGRQAMVIRKTGERIDAATFLEQLAGVD